MSEEFQFNINLAEVLVTGGSRESFHEGLMATSRLIPTIQSDRLPNAVGNTASLHDPYALFDWAKPELRTDSQITVPATEELRVRRSESSQSRQTLKYHCQSRATRNQETMCWRGPAAI
jgi:hypothetical protein